jgi:hypothetical protein
MLLLFGGVIWSGYGSDVNGWFFPLLASYVSFAIGALFLLRVILAEGA